MGASLLLIPVVLIENSFLTIIFAILAVLMYSLPLILNYKMVWERMVDIIETGYFDMD